MSNNNKKVDSTIIAALIGVMGTICVTVITLSVNYFGPRPNQQPTIIIEPTWTTAPTATITFTPEPTSTVPVGEPTSTPAPPTPTLEPTFTVAPPALGSDWQNNCISALWRVYPETVPVSSTNGCINYPVNFSEPLNTFYLENQRLQIRVDRVFPSAQVYGLFAPIPANGTVRIDTNLRRQQEGEIWIGIFAEPNIASQGLVAVLPAGENVRKRELIQRKMPEQAELHRFESFSDATEDPPLYTFVFELRNGEVRLQKIGETEFSAVPLNSATGQLWLFVGYQVAPGNNRMEAEFLNLDIQPAAP